MPIKFTSIFQKDVISVQRLKALRPVLQNFYFQSTTAAESSEGSKEQETINAEHISKGGGPRSAARARRGRPAKSDSWLTADRRPSIFGRTPAISRDWQDIRRDFDDFFTNFERDFFGPSILPQPMRSMLPAPFSAFTPSSILNFPETSVLPTMSMDIRYFDDRYEVKVEVPGIPQEKLTIDVDDTRHSITFTATQEKADEESTTDDEEGFLMKERSIGKSQRTVYLPDDADMEKISSATLKHGVAKLVVPKIEGASSTRTVSIQS